jgi:predicted ribosome quality control (RQC) complex YloA/Tae2 family protein
MERLAITAADIERVLLEVRPRAVGARAAKVRPFGAHGVRLRLSGAKGRLGGRRPGGEERGGLVAEPRAPEVEPLDLIAVFGGPAPRLFGAAVDVDPPPPAAGDAPVERPFIQKLRADLEGATVAGIEQPPGERIVRLRFDPAATLVFELVGRNANAVLLDAAGRVVVVATEKERLKTGEPYAPPVRPATEGVAPAPAPARPPAFPDVCPDSDTLAYGRRLAEAGVATEAAAAEAEARAALASSLERRRRKLEGARVKLEEAMAAGPEGDRWQRLGNLLLANLHRLRRGQTSVDVRDDYAADGDGEDAPAVTIELDPALPPPRQAERLFKRARKIRRGVDVARARLAAGAPPEEAAVLAGAPRAVRPPKPKAGRAEAPSGPRRFRSRDGLEILVGRSNEENDRLTMRVAKGNDLFFHVEGFPGAHTIVRSPPAGKSVPLETLLDAAELAAHYSKAREHGKVSVSYTPRKHVRKPKGARPGLVVLDRHQTLHIRPDEERLKRLLETSGAAEPAVE